jgi:hypothetical protein
MAKDEQTVLVQQGGGALGAYRAGVDESIAKPASIVSPPRRRRRLASRAFSSALEALISRCMEPMLPTNNSTSAGRFPPAFLAPDGAPDALGDYDTSPLKEAPQRLAYLLNRKAYGFLPSCPAMWI